MKIVFADLELTAFVPADCRQLYGIRNHPSVRRGMLRPEPIPYRSHRDWVRGNLPDNPELLLFMVRQRGCRRAIGLTQLRLQGDIGEIGVMFRDPQKHPLPAAYATAVTLHLAFCRLRLRRIDSYVIPGHRDAIRFNRSWGVVETESDRPGLLKFILPAEVGLNNPAYLKVMNRLTSSLRFED